MAFCSNASQSCNCKSAFALPVIKLKLSAPSSVQGASVAEYVDSCCFTVKKNVFTIIVYHSHQFDVDDANEIH